MSELTDFYDKTRAQEIAFIKKWSKTPAGKAWQAANQNAILSEDIDAVNRLYASGPEAAFRASLGPAGVAKYQQAQDAHNTYVDTHGIGKFDKFMGDKIMPLIPAAVLAAGAAPLAGSLLGGAGASAAPVSGDLMAGMIPEVGGTTASTAGLGGGLGGGLGSTALEPVGGSLFGSSFAAPELVEAGLASTAAPGSLGAGMLGSGGITAPSLVAGAGGAGGLLSSLSSGAESLLSGAKSMLGDMSIADMLKLGGGALATGAGLYNAAKDPAQAQMPDFMALAQEQARLNQLAADKQTAANRVNQTNAMGDTSQWTQDPVTGQWTQTQKFGAGNQAIYDKQQALRAALLGQAQQNGALSTEGLPEFGSINMSPVGNSKEIQDATYALLSPYRQDARNAEISRLKAQGLTEGSEAFNSAMNLQNRADTEAQLQALLAGTKEYGNQYQRALQGANLANTTRNQAFGERQQVTNSPYNLMGILGSGTNPIFGTVPGATSGSPANIYGAAKDAYAGNTANVNAQNAAQNNLAQGLFGLGGSLLKSSSFWGS